MWSAPPAPPPMRRLSLSLCEAVCGDSYLKHLRRLKSGSTRPWSVFDVNLTTLKLKIINVPTTSAPRSPTTWTYDTQPFASDVSYPLQSRFDSNGLFLISTIWILPRNTTLHWGPKNRQRSTHTIKDLPDSCYLGASPSCRNAVGKGVPTFKGYTLNNCEALYISIIYRF